MGKRPSGSLLGVALPTHSDDPLHRQLYVAIKAAILDGRLRPGARLPSTRAAATELGLSRTTVIAAFDQLAAEGYLEARVGSGTRVASAVPRDLRTTVARERRESERVPDARIARRARVRDIPDLSFLGRSARPLRPGMTEPSLFPVELWSRLAARHWRRVLAGTDGSDSLGYRPLRVAISEHAARLRAVRCDPEQVLIVAGAQQALYLCGHALADAGDPVWMENPGYPRARWAFRSAGLRLVPVPVDGEGMVVAAGRRACPSPRLIYLTPSFQCPLGVTLSLERRFELLTIAKQRGSRIIEDDYLHEYRAGTAPVASLQSLDRDGSVIYIGNFSKSIVPSLRIGYLILPSSLVEPFVRLRATLSRQPPGAEQAMLAEFISAGHFERLVRASQRLYRERQEALVDAIWTEADGLLETLPEGTGMYLVAQLPPRMNDRDAARAVASRGVDAIPLSAFAMKRLSRGGLVLGYASYDPTTIRRSVQRLVAALSAMPRSHG